MIPETLFGLASAAVLPGWLILIFAPRRWPALNAVPMVLIPAGLSVIYTVLVLTYFAETGGGYSSIAQVRQLFTSDWVLVAGWVHYLAFDLMIGAWAAARMDRVGVNRLTQGFILPAIFMFGPLGLLLALLTETGMRPMRLALPQAKLKEV